MRTNIIIIAIVAVLCGGCASSTKLSKAPAEETDEHVTKGQEEIRKAKPIVRDIINNGVPAHSEKAKEVAAHLELGDKELSSALKTNAENKEEIDRGNEIIASQISKIAKFATIIFFVALGGGIVFWGVRTFVNVSAQASKITGMTGLIINFIIGIIPLSDLLGFVALIAYSGLVWIAYKLFGWIL